MLKFFTTFVPNLKAREMTNGQTRTFVGLVSLIILAGANVILLLAGKQSSELVSWLVFILFTLTLLAPEMGGLGMQKTKRQAFKTGFREIKREVARSTKPLTPPVATSNAGTPASATAVVSGPSKRQLRRDAANKRRRKQNRN